MSLGAAARRAARLARRRASPAGFLSLALIFSAPAFLKI
jgi:hypothetical protein